jgi:hypothetical protein
MLAAVLLLLLFCDTGLTTSANANADENVTVRRYHWCLEIQHRSKSSSIYEQRASNVTSTFVRGSQVMIDDKFLNQTILCDSSVARCTSGNTRENIWRYIYQVIIISSVFILSALSKKLAGSKTGLLESFKRRNRFIEEIENIKRWGNSLKPNVIVEQDWKIDWTSDIWLDNNGVETSSTVLIQYKKTQVKTRDDHLYNSH